jgi:hyperosmotically inducible periplasmic protein
MKRNLFVAGGLLALGLAMPVAAHAQTSPAEPGIVGKTVRTLDDVAITNAIRAELARDKVVSVFDIDVETKKGVVTLRGNVRTEAEAQRAEEIAARDRKNVVRVENRLVVSPTAAHVGATEPGIVGKTVRTIDDVAVTNAIRAELARDKVVSVFDIEVETKKGVVTLRGTVRTEEEARRAAEIAGRDRKNVVRVDNRLVVSPTAAVR